MFSHLSKVSQLESYRFKIPTRPLTPRPVRLIGSMSRFPRLNSVATGRRLWDQESPLCGHSDILALGPLERTSIWRKQKKVEADVGSTALGRLRFSETASPQLTGTSLPVFQVVPGLGRPSVMD